MATKTYVGERGARSPPARSGGRTPSAGQDGLGGGQASAQVELVAAAGQSAFEGADDGEEVARFHGAHVTDAEVLGAGVGVQAARDDDALAAHAADQRRVGACRVIKRAQRAGGDLVAR